MLEQQDEGDDEVPPPVPAGSGSKGPLGGAAGGRHRQHVFPGRRNVVKVLYGDEERSTVARAAELTALRTSGFVAAAALLVAQGLLQSDEVPAEGPVALPSVSSSPPVVGGRPVVVSWSAGADRALLEELVQARLALRRYGVNVNQAVVALHSCGAAVPG